MQHLFVIQIAYFKAIHMCVCVCVNTGMCNTCDVYGVGVFYLRWLCGVCVQVHVCERVAICLWGMWYFNVCVSGHCFLRLCKVMMLMW